MRPSTPIASAPARCGIVRPKVSVAVVTYNHERYIEQAVESVMTQRTVFPFEVVIGEDCSTDRTREILLGLQSKHPDCIRLLLQDRNLGMHLNFTQTFNACRGEYVALLEGDDYWTSAAKLQRQADYLDGHPECSLCCHDINIRDENRQETKPRRTRNVPDVMTLYEMLSSWYYPPTCSLMLRRSAVTELHSWFYEVQFGDWPLIVFAAERGCLGYIRENWGVYRRHKDGIWSPRERIPKMKATMHLIEHIDRYLGPPYSVRMRSKRAGCLHALADMHRSDGNASAARRYALKAIGQYICIGRIPPWDLFRALFPVTVRHAGPVPAGR